MTKIISRQAVRSYQYKDTIGRASNVVLIIFNQKYFKVYLTYKYVNIKTTNMSAAVKFLS